MEEGREEGREGGRETGCRASNDNIWYGFFAL